MNLSSPEECFITNLPTKFIEWKDMVISYEIEYNNTHYQLNFEADSHKWESLEYIQAHEFDNHYYIEAYLEDKKHILSGLILNNKIENLSHIIFSKDVVNRILNEYDYPNTVWRKLNNLFIKIFELQSFDGVAIDLQKMYMEHDLLYFKNQRELYFYIGNLEKYGLIENMVKADGNVYLKCNVSVEGFKHYSELKTSGKTSTNCFVAMSFDERHKYIYDEAIKEAIIETGFKPIKVNDEDAAPEQSINDLIIAKIKECKFIIADFTSHRNGVYFEAGYALGRGLKVIYTCQKDDFKKTHFDTNRYQYIIWNTTEDLKQALINKINAHIKD